VNAALAVKSLIPANTEVVVASHNSNPIKNCQCSNSWSTFVC